MFYLYNNKKINNKRQDLRNNMPQPELTLWYYLRGRNLKDYKFRRQYSVGSFILDFYCPKLRLAIEIDGDSHFIDNNVRSYDNGRSKFLQSENIKIIRFTNIEVKDNIEAVVNEILKYLP